MANNSQLWQQIRGSSRKGKKMAKATFTKVLDCLKSDGCKAVVEKWSTAKIAVAIGATGAGAADSVAKHLATIRAANPRLPEFPHTPTPKRAKMTLAEKRAARLAKQAEAVQAAAMLFDAIVAE